MNVHTLEPSIATCADVFSSSHNPVLTMDPGDTVIARSLDAWGYLSRPTVVGQHAPMMFPANRGHCLIGPIAVRTARPGQVLSITLRKMRPVNWGCTTAGGIDNVVNRKVRTHSSEPAWLFWDIDPDSGIAASQHGHVVDLAPFLGVIGLGLSDGELSTIPPRTVGAGNVDCKDLVAGSQIFIPIVVDDAMLYIGDGHARQGDGEVSGSAIECGMLSEIVVDVLENCPVQTIHARTPTAKLTFGFSSDLNEAMGDALDAMITWMTGLFEVDRATAQALASVVVDLRITQVANQVWGVHAVLANGAVHGR